MMKIAIIGNGAMANAIFNALKPTNFKPIKFARNPKVDEFELQSFNVLDFDTIILAIKPYALDSIGHIFVKNNSLIISILAGTTIEKISSLTKSENVVRAMPNIASKYNASLTTLTGKVEFADIAKEIFDCIGTTIWLDSEKEINIATAIAGSGPAFLALIFEAFSDGGVVCGLSRDKSEAITKALFLGFAKLIENDKASDIKNSVMSPAGTTAAGVATLEELGLRGTIIKTVVNTFEKAISISKS